MLKKLVVLSLLLVSFTNAYADFNPQADTIKAVIPFPPGGGVDMAFRHFQKYASDMGINIVANYKGGADGLVGMIEGEGSRPNGYNMVFGTVATHAIHKMKNPDYTFEYVTVIKDSVMTMATYPSNKVNNLEDLEKVVNDPNSKATFAYGSPSQKGIWDQFFFFSKTKQTPLLVPFKGGAPAVQAVLGEHIDYVVVPYIIIKPYIETGKLKMISVGTRETWKEFNHVSNVAKRYPKWEFEDGFIISLPQNTKPEAVAFWRAFLLKYMSDTQVKKDFIVEYNEIEPYGPEYAKSRVLHAVDLYLKEMKQ